MNGVRRWRLRRAELALQDAQHYYDKWVRFWWKAPSEVRYHERKIARLQARVSRLGGEPEA